MLSITLGDVVVQVPTTRGKDRTKGQKEEEMNRRRIGAGLEMGWRWVGDGLEMGWRWVGVDRMREEKWIERGDVFMCQYTSKISSTPSCPIVHSSWYQTF